ncbi:MAG: mechanosensitive ion channel [Sphingobacteriales bacterium]|nr:mechanosensitive ion channel [Sphingobacteriales bacterium]MCC7223645.1 mechanosensitive ion channel [Chitinophagales bacterium]
MQQDPQQILNTLIPMILQYGSRILGGLLVLGFGWVLIGIIENAIRRAVNRGIRTIDATAQSLLLSALSILLKMVVILAAASTVGIETTSFVAVLGSLGLAAGLALQGSLANLAGGLLLLIFRPVRVGDYIRVQGFEGYTREIQLLTTILETNDKTRIYLPNGSLANGTIINLSQFGSTRLHIPLQISHEADIQQVRQLLLNIVAQHPQVVTDPAPVVVVVKLTSDYVELDIRPWCDPAHISLVTTQLLESFKYCLDRHQIPLPNSHMVVTLSK